MIEHARPTARRRRCGAVWLPSHGGL